MLMLTALALFFFLPTNEPETERGSMSLAESELPALVGALESVAEDLGLEFQPPRPAPGFSVPTAWIVNCGAIQVARFQTRQQRWSYVLRGERFASESDYEHFAQRIHEAHDPYGEVSKTEQHLLESIGTLRFRLFSGGAFRGGCQLERSLP